MKNARHDGVMSRFHRAALALGLARRAETTGPSSAILPPSRAEGGSVPVREALELDAVFRSFYVLQTAVEQLTVDAWHQGQQLRAEQLPPLLRRPDPQTHVADFLGETVTSLAGQGNAYWKITRWTDGQAIGAQVLAPLEVTPYLNRRGRKVLSWRGRDYSTDEIQHLRLLKLPRDMLGLGPVQATQRGLRGKLDQANYADQWFTQGHVPNGVLKSEQYLTKEEAAEYKQQWQNTQNHSEGPAVLGKGLDYQPIILKPAEVQWLDSQKFGVTGVARMFGMPSRYLLAAIDGSSDTYSNQEQEDIAFTRYTLMRYLREIETAFEQLLPRTYTARFNVDALLRTDTKTRYEAHEIGLRAQFLTVPEVRDIEGLPPMTIPKSQPATDQENIA